jgi:hypothetical protein
MCFVQLKPSRSRLEQRVLGESRQSAQKIRTVDQLNRLLDTYEVFAPRSTSDLSIDNSDLDPDAVVDRIAAAFALA